MSSFFGKYFLEHPQSVDETYLQHHGKALSFAFRLMGAGVACLVHALIPGLFVRTGSTMIEELHKDMVIQRRAITRSKEVDERVPPNLA